MTIVAVIAASGKSANNASMRVGRRLAKTSTTSGHECENRHGLLEEESRDQTRRAEPE